MDNSDDMQSRTQSSACRLLRLPHEILVEIMKRLEWRDVLAIRRCSHFFHSLSKEREVWVAMLENDLDTRIPRPFHLPKPLEHCSSEDLERRVVDWWSGWGRFESGSGRTSTHGVNSNSSSDEARDERGFDTRTYTFDEPNIPGLSGPLLPLPSNQYFLYAGSDGTVFYADPRQPELGMQVLLPSPFAEIEIEESVLVCTYVSVDVLGAGCADVGGCENGLGWGPEALKLDEWESTTQTLFPRTFRLAVARRRGDIDGGNGMSGVIEIWDIDSQIADCTGVLTGYSARLRIRFREDQGVGVNSCSILGRYVAYGAYSPVGCFVAIVDWTSIRPDDDGNEDDPGGSDTGRSFTRTYVPSVFVDNLLLLPDKNLLVQSIPVLFIWDWGGTCPTTTSADEAAEASFISPLWACPELRFRPLHPFTTPFVVRGCTRLVLPSMDRVVGLTIHPTDESDSSFVSSNSAGDGDDLAVGCRVICTDLVDPLYSGIAQYPCWFGYCKGVSHHSDGSYEYMAYKWPLDGDDGFLQPSSTGITPLQLFGDINPWIVYHDELRRQSLGFFESEEGVLGFSNLNMQESNDLFAHTSGRWLVNEEINLKLRYRPFNVSALEAIACRSVDAQKILHWRKIGEGKCPLTVVLQPVSPSNDSIGSYNKVFLLQFDNDRKAALRIPNPIVPNVQRTTASEVATMQYLWERWNGSKALALPPKVLAWDSSFDNDVGTPFILLDYAEGHIVGEKWLNPEARGKPVASVLVTVGVFEQDLLSEPFASHGALYFAQDVDSADRERRLYNDDEWTKRYPALVEKYRIGPTVQREWYRDVYEQIDVYRGPWPDMQSMIRDAVELQLKAMERGVAYQNPYIRTSPKDKPEITRYLNMVLSIADIIIPANPALTRPALNHPDLSLDNMVWSSEDEMKGVTNTIDWQGAVVHPFTSQAGMADGFIYNGDLIPFTDDLESLLPFPDNMDSMSPTMQEEVKRQHRLASRHQQYVRLVLLLGGDRATAWQFPLADVLANIVRVVVRVVADGPGELRELLLAVMERWDEVVSHSGKPARYPCPIDFSNEEVQAIKKAAEGRVKYERNFATLCRDIGCAPDGWIPKERYEVGLKILAEYKQRWNEEEMGCRFPFEEGVWLPNLT